MRRETRKHMYRLLPQPKIHDNDDGNHTSPFWQESAPTFVPPPDNLQEAIFAADSFWKLEAAFGLADGVIKTATGYCGGTLVKPTYREVCEGCTGHTEAVRVVYDRRKISFKSLCKVFWQSHDPTNKSYLDFGVGTHHRSAIFCKDDEQRKQAQESKVERQMKLNRRIVTKILLCGGGGGGSGGFYLAENIHQKYYLQQRHVRLCESLGFRSTDQFVESHLACKLNGILSNGDGGVDQNTSQNLKSFMKIYDLPLQVKHVLQGTLEEMEKNNECVNV